MHMSETLDWDTIEEEIKPLAIAYLETVQRTFEDEYDVSYFGKQDQSGGIAWDLTVTGDDDRTLLISFKVVDSVEYEGEMFGYNVSVDAVYDDGEIVGKYTPHNYTENVWTNDLEELKTRAENIPTFTPDDL